MMKRFVLTFGMAALVSAGAAAQDPVKTVRDLYAAAAYEDAIAAAEQVQEPSHVVEQYRVFSLTALGRHDEAQKVMEELVRADPEYTLDPAETPPRVQEAFSKVQQRLLPDVTKQIYLDARAALDRKDRAEAVSRFEKLIKIIDKAGSAGSSTSLGEMRVLAQGFLDLSRALPDASGSKQLETQPDAAPDRAGSPAPAEAAVAPPPVVETRPIAIEQTLPPWVPTDALSRRSTFTGAVFVRIGTDGRVEYAAIDRPVHPSYDGALLRAAREWRYQPATRNGLPVVSELTVEVNLRPPQ